MTEKEVNYYSYHTSTFNEQYMFHRHVSLSDITLMHGVKFVRSNMKLKE